MINAAHVVIYTGDAEADRAFFRDVLGLPSVDAGGGWLIFALPQAEVAMHPTEEKSWTGSDALKGHHQLYLMCDDLEKTLADLTARGVTISHPVSNQSWGLLASIKLPSGSELSIYQPRHPTAYGLES